MGRRHHRPRPDPRRAGPGTGGDAGSGDRRSPLRRVPDVRGEGEPIPPRNGEGDRSPKASGGGVAPPRLRAPRKVVEHARRQRRTGNLPEVILWRALRTRPGGYKFRRQHPDLPGAFDFACLSARLCIEIDGEVHNRGDQPARDERKDNAAAALGLAVLRLPASLILRDLAAALVAIVAACRERAAPPAPRRPLHHRPAAGGPPPRSGEV
ncbi:endonuclease domain-containing protein [Sphingomonas bacterium]|uniref:endonuclease domain-containing protein n=1 Tax=Sphingomonas bacterium TaxID=1895847 RepID=UPI0015762B70|nr:DUF559 domain-containing protein [Sphingomonas bacterium]